MVSIILKSRFDETALILIGIAIATATTRSGTALPAALS
jgi:hypothetical protein